MKIIILTMLVFVGLTCRVNAQTNNPTSFIAVEEKVVTDGRKPRKIEVPVELPREDDPPFRRLEILTNLQTPPQVTYGMGNDPHGFGSSGPISRRNIRRPAMKPNTPSTVTVELSTNSSSVSDMSGAPLPITQPKPTPPMRSGDGPISGGVVNGKARNLVKPKYPPAGKAVRAGGAVSVQVVIDESGKVISATAVGGHPLLRAAAEKAARASVFSPTMLSGQPVKISGTVVYNFAPEQRSATASVAQLGEPTTVPQTTAPMKPLTPEEQRQILLESKFNPAILNLVKRIEAKQTLTAADQEFIKDGKAEIIVRVAEMNPETLAELKKLGFEIVAEMPSAKAFVGRIAPENLAKLAEIENIVFVAPNLN